MWIYRAVKGMPGHYEVGYLERWSNGNDFFKTIETFEDDPEPKEEPEYVVVPYKYRPYTRTGLEKARSAVHYLNGGN